MKILFILLFVYLNIFAYEELRVVTRNSPTTYYFGSTEQPEGFEYDLISAFSKANNYKVKWIVKYSVDDVLKSIENKEVDLAASGLTRTKERMNKFVIGPSYYAVKEQVVCGKGKYPKNISELTKYNINVINNSSYIETLKKEAKKNTKLKWEENEDLSTEDIFEKIHENKIDCTIADSHITNINRRYHPELNVPFSIAKDKNLVWIMPNISKSKVLNKKLKKWFKSFIHTKEYIKIVDRYFSHAKVFDYYDVKVYHKRIKNKLPKYKPHFKKNSDKFNMEWKLLAAQAYQESHWDPHAKSPTGVRGMMMITLPTAKELGIKDRLDYKQSIYAGAKYMNRLIKNVPKEITSESDRYKFALAAYNVGLGHLKDAIKLGKMYDIDPYIWVNMKTLLPLLSNPRHYKKVKYGYARGYEPIKYVTRINNYYEILENKKD